MNDQKAAVEVTKDFLTQSEQQVFRVGYDALEVEQIKFRWCTEHEVLVQTRGKRCLPGQYLKSNICELVPLYRHKATESK